MIFHLLSVIFEHPVTARVQWIEAQATQALPSSSQLDMWIGSGAADAPMQQTEQKRARTEDPTANHKKLVRMMENLDYRLRQLEGATPCFFLPLEGCGLAQAMQAAAAYYDGRSPGKGKPHPDKHRKTTLAGALVKFAAERELQRLSPEAQAALAQTDKLLAAARRPSLVEQHEMIKVMFPLMATPTAMEPEVIACNFCKATKDTKYVLTVQFQPHGVLAQVMPFIEFVILATGGLPSSGAPPKGAQVRGL